MMMNWRGFGRKRPLPNFKVLFRHARGGLRKTTKTSIRIAGRQDRGSNPGPPEYKAGVLTTRPRISGPTTLWGRHIATMFPKGV
jgi:hypothetical protein